MSRGRKGFVSRDYYNKRWNMIKAGKASQYMPRFSLEEAIRRAGL
jgi:hypothetical protein